MGSTGYAKLKAAVERDCDSQGSCGCFNPNGCDVPHQRKDGKSCFHPYCDKFKWTVDRAKRYGEKLGLNWEDILDSWEASRTYGYMNYYQDANQPEIGSDRVRVFDTVDEMLNSLGARGFHCPMCGGISWNPYVCNSGLRMVNGEICNWKVGGLFGDLGKGVFIYCKDPLKGETIFMPLAWEIEEIKTKIQQLADTQKTNLCQKCHDAVGCGQPHSINLYDTGVCSRCGQINDVVNCAIVGLVGHSGIDPATYLGTGAPRIWRQNR